MSPKINLDYEVNLDNFKTSPYSNKEYDINKYERKFEDIEKIIVHCTATDSEKWDNPEACINYDLHPNHISRRGCPTATYHFYIEQDGDISKLVSFYIRTMNCAGHNYDSIAVCINHGGELSDIIEKEQYDSLVTTICYIFDFMDWSYTLDSIKDRLFFHNDFSNKLCPGKNLNKEKLIKDVLSRLSTWGDDA